MVVERWVDVDGFEGFYQVSSHGQIRSLRRVVAKKNGLMGTYPGRELCGGITRGYRKVCLYHGDGKAHNHYVHRLVAQHFLAPDTERPYVNHKNFDTTDNRDSNLEWCTAKENVGHTLKHGRLRPGRHYGEANHTVRIPDVVVRTIQQKKRWKYGEKTRVAKLLGVTLTTLCQWLNGKTRGATNAS